MQDNWLLHLGEATEEVEEIFRSVPAGQRAYEYLDSIHMTIVYELDGNLMAYEREAYTTLDWAGNVGGLYEGLNILFASLIAIFNFNNLNTFFVSQLFHKKDHSLETRL